MNTLPPPLVDCLEAALGVRVQGASPVGGGMINQAARVETTEGCVFVKWNAHAPSGMFDAEVAGLRFLAAAGALRTPAVLAAADRPRGGAPAFLALEYVETAASGSPGGFARRFGEGLARLHRSADAGARRFGFASPGAIGSLPQPNDWRETWPAFYRDCRLAPQIDIARAAGRLPERRDRWLCRVLDRTADLLGGSGEGPSPVHGDLWSGNLLRAAGDEPVLIDPAAHYAHREVEIAYIELFGGFPAGWRDVYEAAAPLDAGYARRRPLLQLYPLLVHLNHFGEMYGPDVDAIASRCGSGSGD